MMKRQFLRVKQIADQTFQRGEKTEVLTDELSAAEKRVELIHQSCLNSGKKLSACVQRLGVENGASSASDRRTGKKVPEAQFAQCLEECGLNLGESSILGLTLIDCARIQDVLACDLLAYKTQIEDSVVEPLQNILKVDAANVSKCRKQLSKLTTDMDSAKLRYIAAIKNCQQVTGNSLTTAVAKAEILREESEEASTKVEQCRDLLAAEMFNLISKEPELSQLFVRLCQLQLEYHRAAVAVLESSLPDIEAQIRSCPYHPVFGVSLNEHLQFANREIAVVIETCVCWLLEIAMNEEGLFRIGGSVTKIKKIKSAFDAGVAHLIGEDKDPHNIAGVLKLYLRTLPEPLLTFELYDDWIKAARISDHDTQLQALWTVVNRLPENNLKNLRYLVKFLSKLCKNSEVNKMSSQNIAIVMGPNLLWPPVEETVFGINMTATNLHSLIVDILITYADWFFPGDCEFYMSTPTLPHHLNSFQSSLRGSQLSLSTTKLSNGDSAVDSLSSSPTNSPKSPSPMEIQRPVKKPAPSPPDQSNSYRNHITRSLSCGVFQPNVNGHESLSNNKLSHQSLSHEDLLKIASVHCVQSLNSHKSKSVNNADIESNVVNCIENTEVKNEPYNILKPVRTKAKANSLPPVMERNRSVERPSVPPPERPPTKQFSLNEQENLAKESKSESLGSDNLDINDISFSLTSENEKFGEQPISFMDDSDFEEEKSPKSSLVDDSIETEKNLNCESKAAVGAGTPNWFDHYNGNRRQSNSLWFNFEIENNVSGCENSVFQDNSNGKNNDGDCPENDVFTDTNDSSPKKNFSEEFRTIIPVGDSDQNHMSMISVEYKPLPHRLSSEDLTIKLRVNSESQNTRL